MNNTIVSTLQEKQINAGFISISSMHEMQDEIMWGGWNVTLRPAVTTAFRTGASIIKNTALKNGGFPSGFALCFVLMLSNLRLMSLKSGYEIKLE